MTKNMRYGKLTAEKEVEYAPKVLTRQHGAIICPSAADYAEDGWLPVKDERPKDKSGYKITKVGWRCKNNAIQMQYDVTLLPVTSADVRQAVRNYMTTKPPNFIQMALRRLIKFMLGM